MRTAVEELENALIEFEKALSEREERPEGSYWCNRLLSTEVAGF